MEKVDTTSLPQKIGVYILKNKRGGIIYIGKSTNIQSRVKTHLKNTSWHAVASLPNPLATETAKIDYILTENEVGALIKESELIKKYKPRYNIMLRDDKQYFYVGFSREKLPQLIITHQPKSKNDKYLGPFTDGKSLKTTLRYLRKAFPYYTHSTRSVRSGQAPHRALPCSYCHINLCPGPDPNISQYKKDIAKIKAVLTGKKPRVISSLKKEMAQLAKSQNFEKAAKARDQIRALENIFSHRNLGSKVEGLGLSRYEKNLANPQKHTIPHTPHPITFETLEAYDISNIQGKEPVASMVRFSAQGGPASGWDLKPDKSMYRRFRIRLPDKPDDFAMMREVIRRRLSHPEWPYPDLFLIDGGKGQLSSALSEIKKIRGKTLKVAALAKKFNELYIPGKKNPVPLDKLPRDTKNILMYARDEAHRFAISYHRKLHRKKFVS